MNPSCPGRVIWRRARATTLRTRILTAPRERHTRLRSLYPDASDAPRSSGEGTAEVGLTRVAVTGGAGFIGHHLVAGLVASGHAVTVIDDLSTGRVERLATPPTKGAFLCGQRARSTALDAGLERAEVVFHLAAVASVAQSLDEPERVDAVNVGGTIRVAEAAAPAGARRLVLAGSSAVYGDAGDVAVQRSRAGRPVSPYGAGKLAAEHYMRALGRHRGVETVALRLFNVFGPGQDPASEYAAVVPRFITAVLAGEQPRSRAVARSPGTTSPSTTSCVLASSAVRQMLRAASRATWQLAVGRDCSISSRWWRQPWGPMRCRWAGLGGQATSSIRWRT